MIIRHVSTGCAFAAMLAAVAACERAPVTSPKFLPQRGEPVENSQPIPPSSAPIHVQFAAQSAQDPLLRDADIRLSVAAGRVRLSGFVQTAAAKHRADEIARQLLGIAAIENRLIVRHTGVAQRGIAGAPIYL